MARSISRQAPGGSARCSSRPPPRGLGPGPHPPTGPRPNPSRSGACQRHRDRASTATWPARTSTSCSHGPATRRHRPSHSRGVAGYAFTFG